MHMRNRSDLHMADGYAFALLRNVRVRRQRESTGRKCHEKMGCSNAKAVAPTASDEGLGLPSRAQKQARAQPLTAAQLEEAVARYSKTTVLRALLTHDPALGGVAIKLISVRWLISYFQANPSARLEHRQHLERTTPEAFVEGAKLERMLAELETGESRGEPIKEGVYMTEVGGEYKPVKDGKYGGPVEISFPSTVAMSHMCAPPPRPPSNAAARGPAATH